MISPRINLFFVVVVVVAFYVPLIPPTRAIDNINCRTMTNALCFTLFLYKLRHGKVQTPKIHRQARVNSCMSINPVISLSLGLLIVHPPPPSLPPSLLHEALFSANCRCKISRVYLLNAYYANFVSQRVFMVRNLVGV